MRRNVTRETLKRFMRELAAASSSPGKLYLAGGATALLLGFREQTIDIDLKLDPEPQGAFQAIAMLKDRLNINVELASPDDFIPRTSDWRERAKPIESIGLVDFFHYDFALQALAKIERGHTQDLRDAESFVRGGYVDVESLPRIFSELEPALIRYPAIDPGQFRAKLQKFLQGLHGP